MASKKINIGLSLLDIISCALGASIILAILFSVIKTPLPSPVIGEFIMMEVTTKENRNTGEIGFILESPNGQIIVVRPDPTSLLLAKSKLTEFQLATDISIDVSKERQVYYFVLTEPISGDWFVTSYLVDDTSNSLLASDEYVTSAGTVKWWTKDREYKQKGNEFYFKTAGEFDMADDANRVITVF